MAMAMERELAADMRKKLDIQDRNLVFKLEKIAELEFGEEIIAMVRSVVSHPGKKTGHVSAAAKINIPLRPRTKRELHDQLTQEIKWTSFTETVLEISRTYLDQTEQQLIAREDAAFATHCAAVCGPSRLALLQNAVDLAASSAEHLMEDIQDFSTSTAFLIPSSLTNNTSEINNPSCMDCVKAIAEPLKEREQRRKENVRTGGENAAKDQRYDSMLQSKVKFRVEKLLTVHASLWDFIESCKRTFSDRERQNLLLGMDQTLQTVRASVQDGEDIVTGIFSEYSHLERQISKLTSEKEKKCALMNSLIEEIMRNREQIVRLQKLSFKMRLEKAVKNILETSRRNSYSNSLTQLNALIEELSTVVPPLRFDQETGLEIPFCPFSETQLDQQLKSLVMACHRKQEEFSRIIQEISEMHQQALLCRQGTLMIAVEQYEGTCLDYTTIVKNMLHHSKNMDFSKEKHLLGMFWTEMNDDSSQKELLHILRSRADPHVDFEPYWDDLETKRAKSIVRFGQQDLAAEDVIFRLENTVNCVKAVQRSMPEPENFPSSGSDEFHLKIPDHCFDSGQTKPEFYVNLESKTTITISESQSSFLSH